MCFKTDLKNPKKSTLLLYKKGLFSKTKKQRGTLLQMFLVFDVCLCISYFLCLYLYKALATACWSVLKAKRRLLMVSEKQTCLSNRV